MNQTISEYMTETPHSIGEDIPLSKAIEMMREYRVRHLPVQYGGRLRGVLSDRDVKLALSIHPTATDLKVGDIMTDEPYAVSPDEPLAAVLEVMGARKLGCVIVKNASERAIGIFTVTDAVRLLSCILDRGALPESREPSAPRLAR